MLDNTLDALADDIDTLACRPQIDRFWRILDKGTSAHRQLQLHRERRLAGDTHSEALNHVVQWLARASAGA